MKKTYLGTLGMTLALAAMSDPNILTEQGSVGTSKPKQPDPVKEPTPFKEQEGIKRMISEYRRIKSGECKKGQLKQNRIVQKINHLLEKGYLKPEDLSAAQNN